MFEFAPRAQRAQLAFETGRWHWQPYEAVLRQCDTFTRSRSDPSWLMLPWGLDVKRLRLVLSDFSMTPQVQAFQVFLHDMKNILYRIYWICLEHLEHVIFGGFKPYAVLVWPSMYFSQWLPCRPRTVDGAEHSFWRLWAGRESFGPTCVSFRRNVRDLEDRGFFGLRSSTIPEGPGGIAGRIHCVLQLSKKDLDNVK